MIVGPTAQPTKDNSGSGEQITNRYDNTHKQPLAITHGIIACSADLKEAETLYLSFCPRKPITLLR